MQVSSAAVAGLIGVYQRYISPHKGYRCAYRVHHGGQSCSEFARQAILADGVLEALPAFKQRLIECREAYAALRLDPGPGLAAQGASKDDSSPATKQGDTCVNMCTLPCL
jgi:putative component of membrane protein insertase Oxa1/YidC/SpoIIIJ protein YidD